MINQGTGTQQKICFLTTYHSSFMVRWWVLVHCGQTNRHVPWGETQGEGSHHLFFLSHVYLHTHHKLHKKIPGNTTGHNWSSTLTLPHTPPSPQEEEQYIPFIELLQLLTLLSQLINCTLGYTHTHTHTHMFSSRIKISLSFSEFF